MTTDQTPTPHRAASACAALLLSALYWLPSVVLATLPFEHTGNLYVSMWNSNEIATFNVASGTAISRFSADGLDGPRGIAFNPANGDIWVAAERSDAIFIFDHQHNFLRTLEHRDFNEPVAITFYATTESADNWPVYISNSNGNEIMVFDQAGNLLRRFTHASLDDPNCTAQLADGRLLITNRLGGVDPSVNGAVAVFDSASTFQFDFSSEGISSLMAVARDTNNGTGETLWASSGAGTRGIYEFDLGGNLQRTLLAADIGDGRSITPQGLAFDSTGDFIVISLQNEVIAFDGDGNFQHRFATGDGGARSAAFQGCQSAVGSTGQCQPVSNVNSGNSGTVIDSDDSGSGSLGGLTLALLLLITRMAKLLPISRRQPAAAAVGQNRSLSPPEL